MLTEQVNSQSERGCIAPAVLEHLTTSADELMSKARMWQGILGLTDWRITVEIADPSMMSSEDFIGQNNLDMINKAAAIYILDEKYYGERPLKYCAEKILVHEMLHCLYDWVAPDDTYEGRYVDTMEHRRLEELARGFIMAKYEVDRTYFWNMERAVL